MIWLLVILILFIPFIDESLKLLFKKRNGNYNLILWCLIPLVFISNLLIPLKIISFQIFTISVCLAYVLFLISCIIFFIKKIKQVNFGEINFSITNVGKNLSYALVSLIILSITVVLVYFSISIYPDTIYYIEISGNFTDSIYSDENTLNLYPDKNIFNQLIPSINIFYAFTPLFWCISVFFPNDITMAYGLIIPLIMMSISLNIIRNVLSRIFKKQNILIYLLFSVLVLFSFQWYFNMSNNGSWIVGFILVDTIFRVSKKNNFFDYFSLIGYAFFSSTGPLLLVFISFSLLAIFILFSSTSFNKLCMLLMFLYNLLICMFCCFPYYQITWIPLMHVLLQPAMFIGIIGSYLLWKRFIKIKFTFTGENLIYKKWFHVSSLIIVFSTIAATFFLVVFDGIPCKSYFEKNWIYLYLIISLYLGLLFTVTYKSSNMEFKKIIYLIFSVNISVVIFLLFSWNFYLETFNRLFALFVGIGPTFQLPISLFTAIFVISYAASFFTNEIYDFMITRTWWSHKLFDRFIITSQFKADGKGHNQAVIKKRKTVSAYMMSSMVGLCVLANFANFFNSDFVWWQINSYKNNNSPVYYMSNEDLKFLETINFDNFKYSYISDLLLDQIVNKGVKLTSYMNFVPGHNYFLRSQVWYTYGFFETMKIWNDEYKYQQIEGDLDSLETLNTVIDNTIEYVPQINIKNIYDEAISEINYFVLKNDTNYFYSVSEHLTSTQNYERVYSGNNISVFHLQ